MKKVVIGLVVMMLLLLSCSGEERQIKKVNEHIKIQANYVISSSELKEKRGDPVDHTSIINLLKQTAEHSDNEYEKEMNTKMADLLEKGDLVGVKALYVELGGELK